MKPLAAVALVVVFALALLAGPLAANAEQPGKVYRIGMLWTHSPEVLQQRLLDEFRDGLREHGYTDGQNIALGAPIREREDGSLPRARGGVGQVPGGCDPDAHWDAGPGG